MGGVTVNCFADLPTRGDGNSSGDFHASGSTRVYSGQRSTASISEWWPVCGDAFEFDLLKFLQADLLLI
jgi:hypothetical protein